MPIRPKPQRIVIALKHLLLLFGLNTANAEVSTLTFSSTVETVSVYDHQKLILTYQVGEKSQNDKWHRSNYIHPLVNLKGEVVTEDFPQDHPHHRGIFWAWHQAWLHSEQLGDAWVCNHFQWTPQSTHVFRENGTITIANELLWETSHHAQPKSGENNPVSKSEQTFPIVLEKNWIKVYPTKKGIRLLDVSISLRATQDGIKIGGSENAKGYGGFSVRLKLNGQEQFSSLGKPIEPTIKAIQAGTWVDISTPSSGLAIINHPDNPGIKGNTAPWILRKKSSMQNAVYPGRESILLERKKPLELRYRIILHHGDLDQHTINVLADELRLTPAPWEDDQSNTN